MTPRPHPAKTTVPLLLTALASLASPLAGQSAARLPVLLRVPAAPTGMVVWLDSLSIGRFGDSTFIATAVYQFDPAAVDRFGSDTEVETLQMDCAGVRSRGRYAVSMHEHPSAAGFEPLDTARPGSWEPVSDADRPIFAAICDYLASSFAAPLLAPEDTGAVETHPALLNAGDVMRRIAQGYPPLLRDRGTTGMAVLRMRVTADGQPDPAALYVLGATRSGFARAAAGVARHMRWRPATTNGKPVAVWVELPIMFQLQQ
jgi:protein TonB